MPAGTSSFRELAFHEWVRRGSLRGRGVRIGIGDDAAVLEFESGSLLATSDSLVEGVHFLPGTRPRSAGRKAILRALSDIAAMAGVPRFALLSIVVPPAWSASAVRGFVEGFRAGARRFGVPLVGGDAACGRGPFVASVALLGECGPRGPILRSGARAGDLLLCTGTLGGSSLGRHLLFVPRLREALALARLVPVHAAIDVSDGLALDLHRICRASGIGAVLFEEAIPISEAARRLSRKSGRPPLLHALGDGEDYELLFALSTRAASRVRGVNALRGLRVIGGFGGTGVRLRRRDGTERKVPAVGWEHGRGGTGRR